MTENCQHVQSVSQLIGLVKSRPASGLHKHAYAIAKDSHTGCTGKGGKPKEQKNRSRKQMLIYRPDNEIHLVESGSSTFSFQPCNCLNHCTSRQACDKLSKRIKQEKLMYVMALESRRESIAQKIRSQDQTIKFSKLEELDILRRFSAFIETLPPDEKYCIYPDRKIDGHGQSNSLNSDLRFPILLHQSSSRPHSNHCYIINEKTYALEKENGILPRLPTGTKLLKPGGKLVELVSLAIDQSPDGVLQAQQVYCFLIKKYPYFAFMDKFSSTSWRSSIRHALYQKWFKKIALFDDKFNNKGCFWALNPEITPKDWSTPSFTVFPRSSCSCLECRKYSQNHLTSHSLAWPGEHMVPERRMPFQPITNISCNRSTATTMKPRGDQVETSLWGENAAGDFDVFNYFN